MRRQPLGNRRRRGERGASAVEFALVCPILIVLLLGIIDLGALFAQQLSMGNAARQAGRFGVVEGRTCQDIVDEATSTVPTIGLESTDVAVTVQPTGKPACTGGPTIPCSGVAVNGSVTVTLTTTSDVLVPFPPFPESVDLQSVGEFRCEFS
jgi:Flp pilus assembly protein TadG